MPTHVNDLTGTIIGAAIEVHKHLGAGLLESAYHKCLAKELSIRGIPFKYKEWFSLDYKGLVLDKAYEIDLLVADSVIVEVKSVEALNEIHLMQTITHLKLTTCKVGLLINFNVLKLKDGITIQGPLCFNILASRQRADVFELTL